MPDRFWAGDDVIGEAETDNPLQGLGLKEDIEKMPTAKADQCDELFKFVLECLRETDNSSCVVGDPPAFITLGF